MGGYWVITDEKEFRECIYFIRDEIYFLLRFTNSKPEFMNILFLKLLTTLRQVSAVLGSTVEIIDLFF